MTRQPKLLATKPTHRLYNITGEGKSARWTEIGAAWPNKDGRGHSFTWYAYPTADGHTVMREITERAAGSEQEAA